MIIDKIETSPNSKYLNFSYSIANDHSINFTFNIFEAITDIRVYATVNLQKNKNDRNYQRKLLQTTFLMCKIFRGVAGDFLGKILVDIANQYADKPLGCPLKVTDYNFKSIVIEDKLVPKFLLLDDIKARATTRVLGKVPSQQKSIEIFNSTIYARLPKNDN